MNNTFVLVNPVSANASTGRVWPEIERKMKLKGLAFASHLTTGVGDATVAVRKALKDGKKTIIAVGGDGTVNEVVNGFFEGETPINPEARLGIISRGTGCDLIRTLAIPKDFEGALTVILANREKIIDLALMEYTREDGALEKRYFANIADSGLGAVACTRVNSSSKSAGGLVSYLSGTLATLLSFKCPWARVEADGKTVFEGPLVLAATANGCYFGGGMHLAPNAEIDDGKLDLVVVGGMNKLAMLLNLARIYRGTHLSDPRVSVCRVQHAAISGKGPLAMEMDGETPGYAPLTVTVQPSAITVLC